MVSLFYFESIHIYKIQDGYKGKKVKGKKVKEAALIMLKYQTEQVKNLRHLQNLRDLKNNQREKRKIPRENKKPQKSFEI